MKINGVNFLSRQELRQRHPDLSPNITYWVRCHPEYLPKSTQIGGRVFFRESDVIEWENALIGNAVKEA